MSNSPAKQPLDQLEAQLEQVGQHFPYPITPDLAGAVEERLAAGPVWFEPPLGRLGWVVVTIGLTAFILLAVPPVRAAVLEVLRLGAVRIFLVEPTATATLPPPTAGPESPAPVTPSPSATPLASILELAGETSLDEAQSKVSFPLRLPGYPPDLGPPDRVFFQRLGGPVVILVWLEEFQPDRVRFSLSYLGPGTYAQKIQPVLIEETTVHGRSALWTEGPYLVVLRSGDSDLRRLVDGHVLIWTGGEITYRLETDLTLEEAVRIAESLP